MPLFAGRVLLRDEVMEGWLEVEEGKAKAWGEGPAPERPDATGWIVPAFVNAHTHVGDSFLRGVPGKPTTVAALVGPGGWKQQHLQAAKPAAVAKGIQDYVAEMGAIGTAAFLDFREGGVEGAAALSALAPDLDPRPIILGRPRKNGFAHAEADALLAVCDGVGLSALRDFGDPADVEAWAEAAHRKRKTFALHASEAKREPLGAVLALEPDFLVHCTQATKRELQDIADAEVPIAICPRSNAYFGMKTPAPQMRDAGVQVAVGTDNGMLQDGNLLAELALLHLWDPKTPLEELLRMATWNGRAVAGLPAAWPPKQGAPLDLVVLPGDPLPRPADRRPGFTGAATVPESP
ncbi:MAG TPA: amidohydrolase family protein [Candidatus Thermoplasmatota archaeon]|nr:amidohydrolase family protein [Candidatus Thermoplasmatota archaeon]